MIKTVLSAFRNYGTFSGRATRTEFWTFAVIFALCTVGAHFIDGRDGAIAPVAAGMGLLELAAFLVLIIPFVSGSARRLHDTGRSGWWLLILYIPYIAFIVADGNESATLASSGAFLLGGVIMLVLLALPGDKDANRFGANPRSAALNAG